CARNCAACAVMVPGAGACGRCEPSCATVLAPSSCCLGCLLCSWLSGELLSRKTGNPWHTEPWYPPSRARPSRRTCPGGGQHRGSIAIVQPAKPLRPLRSPLSSPTPLIIAAFQLTVLCQPR